MSSDLTQAQALMVLNALPHVGPVLLRRLMDAYAGDAVAVLNSNASRLTSVLNPPLATPMRRASLILGLSESSSWLRLNS